MKFDDQELFRVDWQVGTVAPIFPQASASV